jgi:hypothetical protein
MDALYLILHIEGGLGLFTTTYAISAYNHWCCELESRLFALFVTLSHNVVHLALIEIRTHNITDYIVKQRRRRPLIFQIYI